MTAHAFDAPTTLTTDNPAEYDAGWTWTPNQCGTSVGGPSTSQSFALDDKNAYFLATGQSSPGNSIYSVGKDGGTITTLATDAGGPNTVTTDGVNVYWGNTDAIVRIPRGGGARTTLANVTNITPTAIAVDETSVYFTDDYRLYKLTPK
jgi:hypothetical protein